MLFEDLFFVSCLCYLMIDIVRVLDIMCCIKMGKYEMGDIFILEDILVFCFYIFWSSEGSIF